MVAAVGCLVGEVEVVSRSVERWRHGAQVEGDYACPAAVELCEARREIEALRRRVEELSARRGP